MNTWGIADILHVLRCEHIRIYLELVASLSEDEDEYNETVAAVREYAEAQPEDAPAAEAPLFREPRYLHFLNFLESIDLDVARRSAEILKAYAYEATLRELRTKDRDAYVDFLRVVSAEEIVAALKNGTIVNSRNEDGEPAPIRSDEDVSGAFLERPTATAKVDAKVLASVLSAFARGQDGYVANPQGLRLHKVLVKGELNLNWLNCDFPLGFEGCEFPTWISASHARFPWLSFDACDFTPRDHVIKSPGALNAEKIEIDDELRLWESVGLGQLFLLDAKIGVFNPRAEILEGEEEGSTFRTVIGGASFGTLYPGDGADQKFPFAVDSSVRIEKLAVRPEVDDKAVAKEVYGWLAASAKEKKEVPSDGVIEEFMNALARAGRSGAAKELGIHAAYEKARAEGFVGRIKTLFLGKTVNFFYDNIRALYWLSAIFLVVWVAATFLAYQGGGTLQKSPLANDENVIGAWVDPHRSALEPFVWGFLFALELVASPLSIGLAGALWPTSPAWSVFFAIMKGCSVVLMGLFIIGVSGLAERRSKG